MTDSNKNQPLDTEIVELDEKDLAEVAGGSMRAGWLVNAPDGGPTDSP